MSTTLIAGAEVERKAIEETEKALTELLDGICTRKAFVKALPELEKYLPSESVSSVKPTSPGKQDDSTDSDAVIRGLSKLGWLRPVSD